MSTLSKDGKKRKNPVTASTTGKSKIRVPGSEPQKKKLNSGDTVMVVEDSGDEFSDDGVYE